MAKTEIKEKPQITIYPCPRCKNGQILARNDYVCFQCGYEDTSNIGVKEHPGKVTEVVQLLQIRLPCRDAEKIICPKCGKKVCLNNQAEVMVIRSHKDPVTEGHSERPWCDMSGMGVYY